MNDAPSVQRRATISERLAEQPASALNPPRWPTLEATYHARSFIAH
jgi:hypothetical protein